MKVAGLGGAGGARHLSFIKVIYWPSPRSLLGEGVGQTALANKAPYRNIVLLLCSRFIEAS